MADKIELKAPEIEQTVNIVVIKFQCAISSKSLL